MASSFLRLVPPGLRALRRYRLAWLRGDVFAGLTVASLAIPQCLAAAQVAGMPPMSGLYVVVPALLLYGVFGSSRYIAAGPDPTIATIAAVALAPLAAGDPARYAALAAAMAVLMGGMLILAGVLRLGFLADLLPREVLLGYVNGIALTLILDQLSSLAGIDAPRTETALRAAIEASRRVDEVQPLTLTVGAVAVALTLGLKRLAPRWPGILLVTIAATALSALLRLDERGVAVLGPVPAGLPTPSFPRLPPGDWLALLAGAASAALVGFVDGVITARSFAGPSEEIDADRELVGFGVAALAAGFFRGFPLAISNSRTALAAAAGAESRFYAWAAALALVVVLAFFTGPLRHVPRTALAAAIVATGVGLFQFSPLRTLWRARRSSAVICAGTSIGVVVLGVIPAVGLAVSLSLLDLVRRAARPHTAVLGRAHDVDGYQDTARHEGLETEPGLIVLRFDAPIFFANAEHLREQVLALVDRAPDAPRWLLLDAEAITDVDYAGLVMLDELVERLDRRGVRLVLARTKGALRDLFERAGVTDTLGPDRLFPTVAAGVAAFRGAIRSS